MTKPIEFVDFSPQVTDRIALEGRAKYEKFSSLIRRANKWLAERPELEVFSVESVQVSYGEVIPHISPASVSPEKANFLSIYPITKNTPINYIRGLRIWLRPRDQRVDFHQAEVLKYVSVVPVPTVTGSWEYCATDISALFAAANDHFSTNITTGRFVSGEIIPVYLSCDRISPELCSWAVTGKSQQYLDVLRLYYIGADFSVLPATLGFERFFPDPSESHLDVGNLLLHRITEWGFMQPGLRILRIQTIPKPGCLSPENRLWKLEEIDHIAQNIAGVCVIFVREPTATSSCFLQSEVFLPKIAYQCTWWPFGKVKIRHESQLALLERMNESIRFARYKSEGFQLLLAETVFYSIPVHCELSKSLWLVKFFYWIWKGRRLKPPPVVLKCCKVYFRT